MFDTRRYRCQTLSTVLALPVLALALALAVDTCLVVAEGAAGPPVALPVRLRRGVVLSTAVETVVGVGVRGRVLLLRGSGRESVLIMSVD